MEKEKDKPDIKEIEEKVKKEQKKQQNKILIGFLVLFAVVVIAFVVWVMISQGKAHFEYRGVEFDIVDEIAPYRTAIPVILNSGITGAATGTQTDYYFYLRSDPRKLDEINFDGKIKFLKDVVIKSEKDFNCEGDGVIGIANLAKLYQLFGASVIKDPEAGCDGQGRYIIWNFIEGDETEIKEVGPACYEIKISNCEILKATEKIMVESFVEFNKIKGNTEVEI
jgi:hypothetical protein